MTTAAALDVGVLRTEPTRSSVLLPYQQRWVGDTSAVKIAEKSRRIGLTWAEAADDSLEASKVHGSDAWYIGYNKDMALEFIGTVAKWAKAYSLAASEIEDAGDVLEDVDREKGILAYRITFASGHKIVALSSRPANLRGKAGIVVIDEAAFHGELDELIKAAMALTIWGGKVRIISTHNGEDNRFNQLVNDTRAGKNGWSLHRITFDEALAEGLYKRICQATGQLWTSEAEATFRAKVIKDYGAGADEELHVIPKSGGGVFIPGALLAARMSADIPVVRWQQPTEFVNLLEPVRKAEALAFCERELAPLLASLNPRLQSAFGEDFGRSGDLTVMWPGQIREDMVRETAFVCELRNIPFQQQEQICFFIIDRLPRFRGAAFDARGNGQYLAEVAMQRYGAGRVEQVMLTTEWYRANMPPYKAAIEDAMMTFPQHDDILEDHRAIKMQRGVAQVPDNARSVGTDGGQRHADSAVAGCMFWRASAMDVALSEYEGVPRGSRRGATDGDFSQDDDVASGGRFVTGGAF